MTGAGIEIAGLRLQAPLVAPLHRRGGRRRPAPGALPAALEPVAARRPGGARRRRRLAAVALGARGRRDGGRRVAAAAGARPWSSPSAIVLVAWRVVKRAHVAGPATDRRPGLQRAAVLDVVRAWMEPRGFEGASSVVANNTSRALGYAAAFGLAERAAAELPVVPEDDRMAWSNATGEWHVVRVRYPFRPGFGRHPASRAVAGLVVGAGDRPAAAPAPRHRQGLHARRVIDDNFADQADIIQDIALGLAAVAARAAAVDGVARRRRRLRPVRHVERRGLVVRARRPQRVVPYPWLLGPLARRDRYSLFVAVDDGRSDRVSAWLANERTAVPQGARARVRATPLLGYVRSAEPIGDARERFER